MRFVLYFGILLVLASAGTVGAQVVTISAPIDKAYEAGVFSGSFRLTRTGDTSSALTVGLTYSGNATMGADFEVLPSEVVIPAGNSTLDIPVLPINDADVETAPESVVATIAPRVGYSAGIPASVEIVSDDTLPLVSPFLMSATQVSSTSIRLDWTDNFDNETRFRVQRAPAGSSSWTSTDVPANTTSVTLTGLTAGTVYDFRVSAWTNGNATTSPTSNVVRQIALAPPATPRTFETWRRATGLDGALRAGSGRAADDPDGDGKPNIVEYLLGTDPLAPDANGLKIAPGAGDALEVAWPVPSTDGLDGGFVLQESTNLSGNWSASTLQTTTANGTRRALDARRDPVRFYRLAAAGLAEQDPSSVITCWGDSLTGNPGTYAEKLRSGTVLGNRTVQNCGIGGDISQQIRDRMVGVTVTEPFPASSGNATAFTRIVASRPAHLRIMNPASYRGQWATYSATVANVTRVEFFNFGQKIGESSTPLSTTVTANRTANPSRFIAPGNPFENGMIVHFPSGPLPTPLVVGKTYYVRDRDSGGFSLVEGDVTATITANSTSPSTRFVSSGHPFVNGDAVWFPSAPGGFMSDSIYYVRDADAGGFSVASSLNGTALSTVYTTTATPVRGKVGTTPLSLTANFTAPATVQGPFVLNWNHPGGPISLSLRTHTDRDKNTFIFWMGRNNNTRPHETLEHLRTAVEHIKTINGRFLIVSVTNGANEYYGLSAAAYYYPTILLNSVLRQTYPNEFVDVRSALLRAASSSAQDQTDRANDIPPSSLRSDAVHFNDAGQQIIADLIAAELAKRGW